MRKVVRTKKQSVTMEVDGKEYGAMQKKKTVYGKGGLVKKTVVKTKGTPGSVIGKSKEVKRYLSKKAEARKSQTGVEKMDKLMGSGVLGAVPIAIGAVASQIKKRKRS